MITSYTSKWSFCFLRLQPMDCNSGLSEELVKSLIPWWTSPSLSCLILSHIWSYLHDSARRFIQVYSWLFRIRKNHVLGRKLGVTKIIAWVAPSDPKNLPPIESTETNWAVQTQPAKEGGQRSLVASPPPAKRTSRGCWVIVQVVLLGALAVFGFHFVGMMTIPGPWCLNTPQHHLPN